MNGIIRCSLGNWYAVVVLVLTIAVIGSLTVSAVPIDILPAFKSPAVQVLTFYGGMPAANVENDITNRMERWTGQAAGTARQESRSIVGASEVAMPALVASCCTLLVLAPLAMMPDMGTFLFRPMALAVAFSMNAAFVLALSFVPTLCSLWMRPHPQAHVPRGKQFQDWRTDSTSRSTWQGCHGPWHK